MWKSFFWDAGASRLYEWSWPFLVPSSLTLLIFKVVIQYICQTKEKIRTKLTKDADRRCQFWCHWIGIGYWYWLTKCQCVIKSGHQNKTNITLKALWPIDDDKITDGPHPVRVVYAVASQVNQITLIYYFITVSITYI